jgi:ethanolamine ammonia-lyase large subunit
LPWLSTPDEDEVSRLIVECHDPIGFAPYRHWTVGQLRDHLLDDAVGIAELRSLASVLMPEMVAAVAKADGQQRPKSCGEQNPDIMRCRQHAGAGPECWIEQNRITRRTIWAASCCRPSTACCSVAAMP